MFEYITKYSKHGAKFLRDVKPGSIFNKIKTDEDIFKFCTNQVVSLIEISINKFHV